MLSHLLRRLKRQLQRARTALSPARNIFVDAFIEFLVVFVISNAFLLLVVLFYYLGVGETEARYEFAQVIAVIRRDWRPGEVFIYVSAVLAPIPYVMYRYFRVGKPPPLYWGFALLFGAVFLACSGIFAFHRAGQIKNETFLNYAALSLYLLALLVWYGSLVIQRRLERLLKFDTGADRPDQIVAELEKSGHE